MLTKAVLKKHIDEFPEEFTIDELIEKLILIEKIELGIQQSEEGLVLSELELDDNINSWFK